MPQPAERSYDERVRAEMKHFRRPEAFDALPDAHHYWTNRYLRPEVERIYGFAGVVEIYARECARGFERTGVPRALSVGSGRGDVEVDIARRLVTLGVTDFRLDCLEIVPELCAQGRRRAADAGVGDRVSFVEADMNAWRPSEPACYGTVIANQVLHHVLDLEHLFDAIANALHPRGLLLTRDMIGRNGHVCWPEVRAVVDDLWRILPSRLTCDPRTGAALPGFPDRDCSTEGFEGIRAQDILPLLLERFHFEAFVAFGALIERFAGRGFGHNFRVGEDAGDRALVDMVYLLNRRLVDAGAIKPTQLIATLALEPAVPRCGFGWSPAFCLRRPDA